MSDKNHDNKKCHGQMDEKQKHQKSKRNNKYARRKNMLVKEKGLVVLNNENRSRKDNEKKDLSPVEQTLEDFKLNNGYDFLDMINLPKVRKKHLLRQHQIPDYDDDNFLKFLQDKQHMKDD